MRNNFLRLAFLAVLGGVAVPVSAQRTGPCPPAGFGSRNRPATGATITGSGSTLQSARPASEPIDCLFAPDGQVRAALYLSSPYQPSPQVRVFRTGADYGSPLVEQVAETITVSAVSRFSDLDWSTLESIATAAGVRRQEPVAGAATASAPPAPNTAILHLASYNPTTPSTQGSATSLRVTSRTYDGLDRLTSETVELQEGSTATLSYSYWKNGKRKTVTDAMGRVTFYEYDGQNRLKRLTANQGLPDEQVTSYEYWPDDLLKAVTKPDGTVSSYDYDHADRLETVVVRKDGIDLVSYAYTYDANGNRESQVEVNGGPPETTTYTYDDLDRLEKVTYPDGRSVAYGYDNVGNRTSETERDPAGVVVSEKVAVFDAANRLGTVTDAVDPANDATLVFDRNGNLETKTTSAGIASYVYDLRDLLVETRQGEHISARFAYDAFGRRYLKIGNEGIRQYLYDQSSLLEEFTDTNVEVAKYEWGGDRLVSLFRFNEPRRYFHFDALGSVAALTDDTGSVAARYHYDAWGQHRDPIELEASANRFGFTGHYFDTETELYYAKARYFDPKLGRFLTQDSYLGQIDNPPSLHRFFYANANPARYVDPTGHSPVVARFQEFQRKLEETGQRINDRLERANEFAGEVGMGISVAAANFLKALNSPGHMTREAEREYYVQPQTQTEHRAALVTDLALASAPLLAKGSSRGRAPSAVRNVEVIESETQLPSTARARQGRPNYDSYGGEAAETAEAAFRTSEQLPPVPSTTGPRVVSPAGEATSSVPSRLVDPREINFTQRSVSGGVENYTRDMASGQWDWSRSGPLRVMEVDGQLISYDNRRLMAAQDARLESVPVQIVRPAETMPGSKKTWGQAFEQRRNDPRNVTAGGAVPATGLAEQPGVVVEKKPR